ncbi:unnamed protein product [Strongylus vulgaris]|uniref:PH-like domain-containing protein n=1 Tax=Strongylus vulgaris TaxID=40348 RepID=A0A3P7HVS5_STRVU|nr:unnamed protein product [Strongylus vulgaris]
MILARVPVEGLHTIFLDKAPRSGALARKGDLVFAIKFIIPTHAAPTALAGGELARVLLQSGCHRFELKRVDPTPRADYEEQAFEYNYHITLSAEGEEEHEEMIVRFAEKFCYFVGGGFHEQILAEFPGMKLIFGEVRPQHNNVTLTSMAIGSMPNPGLFFVRGDYVTNYNEISNRHEYCSNFIQEDSVLYRFQLFHELFYTLWGEWGQSFLSFAHFEHDRRYLTLFFAVRLCEREEKLDGLRFAAYKISLPYAAIVQIIVDVGDSHNNTLYLKLKYPPQKMTLKIEVWQAVPRTQQCRSRNRRVVNMEQCKEWVSRFIKVMAIVKTFILKPSVSAQRLLQRPESDSFNFFSHVPPHQTPPPFRTLKSSNMTEAGYKNRLQLTKHSLTGDIIRALLNPYSFIQLAYVQAARKRLESFVVGRGFVRRDTWNDSITRHWNQDIPLVGLPTQLIITQNLQDAAYDVSMSDEERCV